MKTCTVCSVPKPLAAFSVDRRKPDGLCVRCKACRHAAYFAKRDEATETTRAYRAANKEQCSRKAAAYYQSTKERRSRKMAEWYKCNKQRVAENVARYRAAHPGFVASKQAKRRAAELRAMPSWANAEAIKSIYARAAEMSSLSGIDYHVDHVYPLISPLVCGLHCEGNLQILEALANIAKSNKLELHA